MHVAPCFFAVFGHVYGLCSQFECVVQRADRHFAALNAMPVVAETGRFEGDVERFLCIVHAGGKVDGTLDVQRNVENMLQPVGIVYIGADGEVVGLAISYLREAGHGGHFAADKVG